MGAWGTGIFANDVACDIRAGYRELLEEGKSPTAARQALFQAWAPALKDSDDGPIIWLALAATQHAAGSLEDEVRAKALAIIDAGGDVERWRETGKESLVRGRKAALERLKATLLSPQKKAKPIRKTPKRRYLEPKSDWPLGEVFGFRLASGRNVLLLVSDYSGNKKFGFAPIFALLDWHDERLPESAAVSRIPIKLIDHDIFGRYPFLVEVRRHKETDLPSDRVVRLGGRHDLYAPKVRGGYCVCPWSHLDKQFEYSLQWT